MEDRIFTIKPVFTHTSQQIGRHTKIYLIYIKNDIHEKTYYVNSPFSAFGYLAKKLQLMGYEFIDINLPYERPTSIRKVFKNYGVIDEMTLNNELYFTFNVEKPKKEF